MILSGFTWHHDQIWVALGLTSLAPTMAATTIKNKTTTPPQIPAAVNEAANPFKPTSSFPKTFREPSAYLQVNSV
jgi:hypothetical protein